LSLAGWMIATAMVLVSAIVMRIACVSFYRQ
jgi:hypothetical protein